MDVVRNTELTGNKKKAKEVFESYIARRTAAWAKRGCDCSILKMVFGFPSIYGRKCLRKLFTPLRGHIPQCPFWI